MGAPHGNTYLSLVTFLETKRWWDTFSIVYDKALKKIDGKRDCLLLDIHL